MGSKASISLLLVLIGVGYAGYEAYDFYSVEMPQLEAEVQAAQAQVNAKQRELARLKEFAQNIENVKRELTQLSVQLSSALEHMPRTFNLSGLLRKLNMLAQNSGVELATFTPRKGEEDRDKSKETFFSTISIEFDLRGSFTQCLVFLDQITRLKRIIDIEKVSFSALTAQQGKVLARGGPTMLAVHGTIRTYRFAE